MSGAFKTRRTCSAMLKYFNAILQCGRGNFPTFCKKKCLKVLESFWSDFPAWTRMMDLWIRASAILIFACQMHPFTMPSSIAFRRTRFTDCAWITVLWRLILGSCLIGTSAASRECLVWVVRIQFLTGSAVRLFSMAIFRNGIHHMSRIWVSCLKTLLLSIQT